MSTEGTTSQQGEAELALAELLAQAERTRAVIADSEAGSDAESTFSTDAAQAISTLELELTVARASLAAERADSAPDLETTVGDVAAAARQWIDDADVQAHLGRMELQDRVSEASQYLDRTRAEVVRAADRVAEAVGTELSDVRSATLSSIEAIRDAIVDSARSMRAATRAERD